MAKIRRINSIEEWFSGGEPDGRIVEEELAREGVKSSSHETLPKGAPIKIRIARRLRESTTLTLREIAVMLHAGAWRSFANALARRDVSK